MYAYSYILSPETCPRPTVLLVQSGSAKLLMVASSCKEAVNMLEALERGVHGVVLHTQSPSEVRLGGYQLLIMHGTHACRRAVSQEQWCCTPSPPLR